MKSKLPKLLIVDDERNMRESLKIVLESHGYKAVSYTHLTLPTKA